MRTWRVISLAVLLVFVGVRPVASQGPGLFVRTDCTTITAPVTGQTWCFDATNRVLRVWNGSTFVSQAVTLPLVVGSGGTGNTTLGQANLAFNYTFNGDQEIFGAGTATVSTGWTASGAGAAYAKNTTAGQFKVGTASLQITPGAGATGEAYQDIDLITGYGPAARWGSVQVTLGAWVRATAASQARIGLDDGVNPGVFSVFHAGDSALTFLTATATLAANTSRVRVLLDVLAAGSAAQFDGVTLVVGSSLTDYIPTGWRGRKSVLLVGAAATQAQATTQYYGPWGTSATEATVSWLAPYKCIVRNLRMTSDTAPAAGQTAIGTFRTSETTDTALTATITSAGRTASDTTNEVQVTAGTISSFKNVNSATSGALALHIAMEVEEIP